jgi:hypothetical protein
LADNLDRAALWHVAIKLSASSDGNRVVAQVAICLENQIYAKSIVQGGGFPK